LRSGARVELYISYGFRDSVVRLPMGQYYKGAGTYELYVEDSPNHLVRKTVRLGEGNRKYVEVISGLNPGDKVAIGDMSQYEKYSSLKIK
ncbi:MAG: efflux RND transporter periplasmic adaptor subunit, partial [Paramuribaculum sp.]|nr:efflux RND transporter periplasmic adaptor subunit [Paramuribaculum sp.]